MKKLTFIVEQTKNSFGAYALEFDGAYGGGNTVTEAKNEALEGLRLFIEMTPKEELPKILQGKYEIVFKYDIQSFLKYSVIPKTVLHKLVGINPSLLCQYERGIKKPRQAQKDRIKKGIHSFAKELATIDFV